VPLPIACLHWLRRRWLERFGAVHLDLNLYFRIAPLSYGEGERLTPATRPTVGRPLVVRAEWPPETHIETIQWNAPRGVALVDLGPNEVELLFSQSGRTRIEAVASDWDENGAGGRAEAAAGSVFGVSEPDIQMIRGNVGVTLHRTASEPTLD
jgi:hypothetical protein